MFCRLNCLCCFFFTFVGCWASCAYRTHRTLVRVHPLGVPPWHRCIVPLSTICLVVCKSVCLSQCLPLCVKYRSIVCVTIPSHRVPFHPTHSPSLSAQPYAMVDADWHDGYEDKTDKCFAYFKVRHMGEARVRADQEPDPPPWLTHRWRKRQRSVIGAFAIQRFKLCFFSYFRSEPFLFFPLCCFTRAFSTLRGVVEEACIFFRRLKASSTPLDVRSEESGGKQKKRNVCRSKHLGTCPSLRCDYPRSSTRKSAN